jgi:hypothetical protein
MEIFLLSLTIIGLSIFGMAAGVVFSNKVLKGSCGGLGKLLGKDCEICENKDKCQRDKTEQSA